MAAMSDAQSALKANLDRQESVSMVKSGSQPSSRRSSRRPSQKSLTQVPATRPSALSKAKPKTAMERLDAADGKMDGKYFGDKIVGNTIIHPSGPHHNGAPLPDVDDDVVRFCDVRDPDNTQRVCGHECNGSAALRTHLLECPYNRVYCPNEQCSMAMPAPELATHLSVCKFEHLTCPTCRMRFYRMDQDYHLSVCNRKKVKCPLLCGAVLSNEEVLEHVRSSHQKHPAHKLLDMDYLPSEHPIHVYGVLLREIEELEAQLRLAQKEPRAMMDYKPHSPVYSPVKGWAAAPPPPRGSVSIYSSEPGSQEESENPGDGLEEVDEW